MNYVLTEPPLLTLVGGHLVRKFKPRIRRSGVDRAVDPSNVPRTAGHISRKGGGVVGSGEFGSGWQILPARQAGLGGHGDLLPS